MPEGIKQLYEFQRIRCTKCLTSPDNHQKKKYHTWKACTCLQHLSWSSGTSKAGAAGTKNGVSGCSDHHHAEGVKFPGILKGQRRQQDFPKVVQNRMANCYPLLKRITKLKCVNSVVRKISSQPKKGCLNWLHVGATMDIALDKNGSLNRSVRN